MSEPQVLIMDDDPDFANFVFDVAKTLKLNCKVITNSNDFMNSLNAEVTLVLLDLNIPNIDGIELLRQIKDKNFKCGIILMSGADIRILQSAQDFANSLGLNVVGHFQKPIRLGDLEELLKKSISEKSSVSEEQQKKKGPDIQMTKEKLESAIKNDKFIIYYQPKVEIATGKLFGVEALVRMLDEENKVIFPDQFISVAESAGLIEEISWIIMKKAIKEIENIKLPFKLSLNLSPYSLHDLTFPDKFLEILNQSSLKPENIVIEITESGLIKELSSALDIFTRLRLKNINLSIDDFGTGFATMQQLKLIPANELKIDKSFVQNMLEETSARVTVQKVIEIGHELGMTVVAEGVETKDHLEFLKDLHCDIAQGYFFSKPIPIAELADWINTNIPQSDGGKS